MKIPNRKTRIALLLCCCVAAAVLAGCGEDPILTVGGDPVSDKGLNSTLGMLRSADNTGNTVILPLGEDAPADESFYLELPRPAAQTVSRTVTVDETLVGEYNRVNNKKLKPFPATNVTFTNDGQLTVAKGELRSPAGAVTLTYNKALTDTLLLALSVNDAAEEYRKLYLLVVKEAAKEDKPSKWIPKPGFPKQATRLVMCINTEMMTPRAAIYFLLSKNSKLYGMFEDINLMAATVRNDNGMPALYFGSDIRHVLNNAERYIRPLQLYGRKVCLTVKGGGQGIGFCNLGDKQIADLVFRLKHTVDSYGLDGLNLWDEGSGYGKEGMPPVSKESYPKLIDALRKAMPDKMITVTDIGEPTASFDEAHAGIRVGELIDYAWHAYKKEVVVNPWEEKEPGEEAPIRKPIAGLDKQKYGACYINNLPKPDSEWDRFEVIDRINAMIAADGPKGLAVVVYDSSSPVDNSINAMGQTLLVLTLGYFAEDKAAFDFGNQIANKVPAWKYEKPGNTSKDW